MVVDERAPLMGFLPLQRIDAERPLYAALPQPLRSVLAVDRKIVGAGKSVDLGCRRIIKKKNNRTS